MTRAHRLLLPVGLPLVVLVGLAVPAVGESVGSIELGPAGFSDLCIILTFLVTGLFTSSAALRFPGLLRGLTTVLVINLLVAPLLGVAAVRALDPQLGLAVGIALMVSVPTTLSSAAVITVNVGGDRLWAVTLTVVTAILGSITAPIAVSAILGANVSINAWPILGQIIIVVLVPMTLGYLVGRFWWRAPPMWLSLLPTLSVLALVWVTMSRNAEAARGMEPALVGAMVVVAGAVHGVLLISAAVSGRGLPFEHAIPVLFVASQKSLPLALAILTLVANQSPQVAHVAAVATITCLVWHFLQLFADSALSHRLAIRHAEAAPAAG